jgi:hypothetical protein
VPLPDFFIVGAPRCGTTAMYEYLRGHPDVFMPDVKEPQFLSADLEMPWLVSRDKYLLLFQEASTKKRVGEASVFYLYVKKAASEIKRFSPDARIIIMLRNPAEMLYSLHARYLASGVEDIADFSHALDAEAERRQGRRPTPSCYPIELLFYRDVAKFSEQVQRYFDVFGRTCVHVILYDDFKHDVAGEYAKTLRFLEVSEQFRPEFKIVNPNRTARSRLLQKIVVNLPRRARNILKTLEFNPLFGRLVRGVQELNSEYVRRPPMDEAVRIRLRHEFAPEIQQLGTLVGRDLSAWTRDEEPL